MSNAVKLHPHESYRMTSTIYSFTICSYYLVHPIHIYEDRPNKTNYTCILQYSLTALETFYTRIRKINQLFLELFQQQNHRHHFYSRIFLLDRCT